MVRPANIGESLGGFNYFKKKIEILKSKNRIAIAFSLIHKERILMKCLLITSAAVVLISSGCSSPDPLGHYKGPAIDAIHAKMREVAIERFGTDELIGLGDRDLNAKYLVMNNHNKGYSLQSFVSPDTGNTETNSDFISYRISTGDSHEIINLVIRHNQKTPEILIGKKTWDEMGRLVH